ncbi:pantoate--beta-alanine ligase [Leucobacter allii]|uniref:Pantothenate synthetase n=1 Tax=Leucobacter allii TaxID=2932247 RepID=A0ABY4FK00_9MICO|nr:pantoate--beta-alanine ligase [Leucobacter allii]UOQ56611.1 pantoate--beta-alanine ligase [Leucobacter allii]
MKIVRTVAALRAELREARAVRPAATVGLVPTMGALHEGHLSLVRAARRNDDVVVMSIFVNPTQFTEAADLAAYPRQEAGDTALAERAGVDLLFAPEAAEMYREGHATGVHVEGPLTATLEGAVRGSAHFDGMATIVTKLLLAALPDAAYFGEKDAQQLRVVRRMVADLGIPTRIVGCPTSRDDDGLARSSRNVRLSPEERSRALAIPRALEAIASAALLGETRTAELFARGEEILIASGVSAEYLAFVDPDSFAPRERLDGPVLCAVAARVGEVRLIDNVLLGAGATADSDAETIPRTPTKEP